MINNWEAKLWSRFFCLSVYITMYLNDHQRTAFYESLGMNTKQFNQHVIVETNNSAARIFPEVRLLSSCCFSCWLSSLPPHSKSPGACSHIHLHLAAVVVCTAGCRVGIRKLQQGERAELLTLSSVVSQASFI